MVVHTGPSLFVAGCHRDTQAIYRYWLAKCEGRRMPARSDLDPAELQPRLLPGICLIDVVPDDRRYVYRLVGTGEVEVRGHDPTGESPLQAFFVPTRADAVDRYDQVVTTCAPVLDAIPFSAANSQYVTEETVFLPLSTDAVTVNMILVFSHSRHAY